MKHCSSGREKLFCGRQPGSGKWWCSWALGNMERFHAPHGQLLLLEKFLDSRPAHAALYCAIRGKS